MNQQFLRAPIIIVTFVTIVLAGRFAFAEDPCNRVLSPGPSRPHISDLPPPLPNPEDFQEFKIRNSLNTSHSGDSGLSLEVLQQRLERFLRENHFTRLHAMVTLSPSRDNLILRTTYEIAQLVQDLFPSNEEWSWITDADMEDQSMRPDVQRELNRRETGVATMAMSAHKMLTSTTWMDSLDLDKLRIPLDELEQNFSEPQTAWPEPLTYAENRQLARLHRQVHALRNLTEALASIKTMGFNAHRPLEFALATIESCSGNATIRDLGYKIANLVVERIADDHLLDSPLKASSLQPLLLKITLHRPADGLMGPVAQFGRERLRYLQWAQQEKGLDERVRLTAQSLLRRLLTAFPGLQSNISLLPRTEVESLYLRLGMRVRLSSNSLGSDEEPGFVLDEATGQTDLRESLIIADLEAQAANFPMVDWGDPQNAQERLTQLMMHSLANLDPDFLVDQNQIGFEIRVPLRVTGSKGRIKAFYRPSSGILEVLNFDSLESFRIQDQMDRPLSNLPEIEVIRGSIDTLVLTDPVSQMARQYRLRTGQLLRVFEPQRYVLERLFPGTAKKP